MSATAKPVITLAADETGAGTWRQLRRGVQGLAACCIAQLRRAGRTDRRDAPHRRRRAPLDLRSPLPACAELLSPPAGTRSAAACHLHRLAHAQDARRSGRRRSVRRAGRHRSHGAQLDLRHLGQCQLRRRLVLRPQGRGARRRHRGRAARRPPRPEITPCRRYRGRGFRRVVLLCRPLPARRGGRGSHRLRGGSSGLCHGRPRRPRQGR